jgi:hypothetical protein
MGMGILLVLAGHSGVRRSDVELHDSKHLRKEIVKRMMGMLGSYLGRGWFYSLLVSVVGGSEVPLEQV